MEPEKQDDVSIKKNVKNPTDIIRVSRVVGDKCVISFFKRNGHMHRRLTLLRHKNTDRFVTRERCFGEPTNPGSDVTAVFNCEDPKVPKVKLYNDRELMFDIIMNSNIHGYNSKVIFWRSEVTMSHC